MMVRLVLEQEADLASISKPSRKVEGSVSNPVLCCHAHAVKDEELSGHHAPGQDALVD